MVDHLTLENTEINTKNELENIESLLATYRLLPNFKRELAIDRAIANVSITSEENNLALQDFQQRYKLTTQEAIQSYCQAYSLTPEQLQMIALREFKIEKFKQQTWGNRLESEFLNRRASLDRAIYSVIRHKNPELLQELFFRIYEGEQTFAELASQYSQGIESQTGGMIGPVPLSKLPIAITEKLRHSLPQQVLPPFAVEEWFVILRLEKFMPAQFDAPNAQVLLNQLFEEFLKEQNMTAKVDS